jgi:outer membrane receptor protein involved in Fe transport
VKQQVLALLLLSSTTYAQGVTDIEVPTLVFDQSDTTTGPVVDESLDLANIVQSAAKGVTTVQEAPAIVTVITDEEIRDRQFQNLPEVYDGVPGWSRFGLFYSVFPMPIVRGQVQAVQFLHDGVSLFDPSTNTPATIRTQPMELIKRIEMITGPGGVLWGSNSLLGILNIITKDAEDIEGFEVGGSIGDGNGDRRMARAYVMAGSSGLLDGKLKLFGHGSVETYQGETKRLPVLLFHNALPQPNSANVYGPLADSDQMRSLVVNLHTKVTFGPLQLRAMGAFGPRRLPAGFSGNPSREHLPEDERCPAGVEDPSCADPLRTSRRNQLDVIDRYAVAEYRTRFADEKAGITVRTYAQQFLRGSNPLQVLTPSALVQGGLALTAKVTSYRVGAAFDGDIELGRRVRTLYGAEAFREWNANTAGGRSRQGDGVLSTLEAPYDLNRIPLLCPRIYDATANSGMGGIVHVPNCPLTFSFPADRTVVGAYVNPQWRPNKKLIFDLGGRLQVAPEALGGISYPLNTTIAGSFVWNFIPDWHLKLNYAQGFRPPVFNNTTSNGEGVQIGGNPDLEVETSDAAQVEVNARIFKGQRRVRELSFRIDGSYTRVNNLIQIQSGQYNNSGERGLASVEFLGRLYVQGGHRIELGYTYLRGVDSERGTLRNLPEHWFELATVFQLVSDKLSATTRLRVTGAAEDSNRLVEYRDLGFDAEGEPTGSTSVDATDVVLDRLPPVAELSLGVQYMPTKSLAVRLTAYNALVSHAYMADAIGDYEPHLEYLPNPYEGFRAYLSAMYAY